MSRRSFADYIDFVEIQRQEILRRIDSGEGVYMSDLESLIERINYVLHNLPIGTSEEGVPPGSYNRLVEIRDGAQRTLNSSRNREQNAGKKRNGIRNRKRKSIKNKNRIKNRRIMTERRM